MSLEQVDEQNSDSLGSVMRGAGLFFIGKIISKLFGLVTNVILTRLLGANLYGIYTFINIIYGVSTQFTRLGGDKAIMRFLPEYETDKRKRHAVLFLSYGTSLGVSICFAALIYYFAPLLSSVTLNDLLFVKIIRITAIVIPFNTASTITHAIFKGLEKMEYHVGVVSIARPAIRLIFIGGAVVLGYSLVGAAAGLVISGILIFIIGLIVFKRKTDLSLSPPRNRTEVTRYYDFSLPLTLNQIGNFLYNRIDLLMIGFLLTGSAVGVYNVAVLVSSILSLPLTAFNQLFPAIASGLYSEGKHEELGAVFSTVTRLAFTITLPPALATAVYAPEVLILFGEEFTASADILILFVIAQMANAIVGPSGFLLMMSDRHYLTMVNQIGAGLINAVLNYFFIGIYGLAGAALATASVLVFINFLRLLEVWYYEELTPYDREYMKPIAAGIVTAGVMYSFTHLLQQYQLLLAGSLVGGVAFLTVLYILGIKDEDIELLRNIV